MAIESGFRFIRPKELDKILGISRAKREAMVRDGLLPKPYSLGRRAVGFRSDEIEAALLDFPRKESAYAHSVVPPKSQATFLSCWVLNSSGLL